MWEILTVIFWFLIAILIQVFVIAASVSIVYKVEFSIKKGLLVAIVVTLIYLLVFFVLGAAALVALLAAPSTV